MWRKIIDGTVESEFLYYFFRSTSALVSSSLCLIILLSALFAPLISASNPYDLTTFDLLDSLTPPFWEEKGSAGIIRELRNVTGLRTLEIDTGADTTETALLVGKYLAPQFCQSNMRKKDIRA